MEGWSESQVQEWVGLIGLAAAQVEIVQKALAQDDADGEDLEAMTAAFQSSGTAKPLQRLLKRAGTDDPPALAKETMALHDGLD